MTKDKNVTMSRELAESLDCGRNLKVAIDALPELRALLAAPVVERQEPFGFWRVPIGYPLQGMFIKWDDESAQHIASTGDVFDVQKLYTSPPAPVSVVLPTREVMRDLIAEVIGGDTYDCTRVWSAWGVGTMSEDDFVPVVEQEERLYELADACLDKVKELNQ